MVFILPHQKLCKKCNKEQDISEFYKSKTSKDGLRYYCKSCNRAVTYKWVGKNSEKIKLLRRDYRKNNIEKINQYRKDNKESINKSKRLWDSKNKEKSNECKKTWEVNNRDKINQKKRERRANNPTKKLSESLSCLLRNSFKQIGRNKNIKTTEICGCTSEEFILHIQSLFIDGMTLYNHGSVWHFDHIIPISLATTYEEVIILNHYTNIRPLLAMENIIKRNALIPELAINVTYVLEHIPRIKDLLEKN